MRRNPACALLRKLISPYGYGSKDEAGYRRPTNQSIQGVYNHRGYIRGPNNARFLAHFRGEETLYYWADGRVRTPACLLKIDVDCHKVGGPESARAFAEHLRDAYFPGLYFEPSTNGNGVHAYVVLDKRGYGSHYLHSLYTTLDKALKAIHRHWQARHPDLPVELVEVKGHPPRIEWDRSGLMSEFVSGQFAKLPRELLTRFDEFQKTTVLDDFRVHALSRQAADLPVVVPLPEKSQVTEDKGSTTGSVVTQAALERYPAYLSLARRLLPEPIETSGRDRATAEDMAIFLMILEACTLHRNADGSMPTRRIQRNWELLKENGEVDRPWNSKRYTALRNYLSREGYLHWEDTAYLPGPCSSTGKGQAARWRASEELLNLINQEGEEDPCGDNSSPPMPTTPSDEPDEPQWLVQLRLENYPRPIFTPSIGSLRLAA